MNIDTYLTRNASLFDVSHGYFTQGSFCYQPIAFDAISVSFTVS